MFSGRKRLDKLFNIEVPLVVCLVYILKLNVNNVNSNNNGESSDRFK